MYKVFIKSMNSRFKRFMNDVKRTQAFKTKATLPSDEQCQCNSIQILCPIHRNDPMRSVNPQMWKDYWKRRDELDALARETKLDKVKKIFINLCKCIISWDFSRLRLLDGAKRDGMTTWSNRWAFIRLFGNLIEFKLHLTNHTYNRAWYYGITVRFRMCLFGVFKTHLVFDIGPDAN